MSTVRTTATPAHNNNFDEPTTSGENAKRQHGAQDSETVSAVLARRLHREFLSNNEPGPGTRESALRIVRAATEGRALPATTAVLRVHTGPRPDPHGSAGPSTIYAASLSLGTAARAGGEDATRSACLAAALAIARRKDLPPTRILSAYELGCLTANGISDVLKTSPELMHWDDPVPGAVIGAAVTAGLLGGGNAETLRTIIGSAASQVLGHRRGQESELGPFHIGKAAANGVLSVVLTEAGLTSPQTSLEGPKGLFNVFRTPELEGQSSVEVVEHLANRILPVHCKETEGAAPARQDDSSEAWTAVAALWSTSQDVAGFLNAQAARKER